MGLLNREKLSPNHDAGGSMLDTNGQLEIDKTWEPEQIVEWWQSVIEQPDQYIQELGENSHQILFTAGGRVPEVYGMNGTKTWDGLVANANEKNEIEIAGVTFSLDELAAMGAFYRWASKKGYHFHCIDERLIKNRDNKSAITHANCGACAAVEKAARLPFKLEDNLAKDLGIEHAGDKQPIEPALEVTHNALAILIDLHGGGDTLKPEIREEMKLTGILPFNVSIPLNLIKEWASETGNEQKTLISTMVRWSVQIARNIIGSHNTLSNHAEKTIIITDERNTEQSEILEFAKNEVTNVQAGRRLRITDKKAA